MKSDRPEESVPESPFDEVPSPKQRAEHLAALKAWKMALDAHAFVRASAGLFYRSLADGLDETIPGADPIWISGDCHGENLGAVGNAHGTANLDLNDLDETVVGWAAHDLVRLALDMTVAARSYEELRGVETVAIVAAVLEGYCDALSRCSPGKPVALVEAPPQLRKLIRRTAEQTRTDLLDRRVPRGEDGKRRFAFGPRYFPLADHERAAIDALIAKDEMRTLVASLTDEAADVQVEVLDAAFRVAGTGSLGCWRAAALVRIGSGKKEGDARLRLVDIKEALPSDAIRHPKGKTPTDDADRVVSGARALVPMFGERMLAATVLHRRVVVRELLPQDRKVNLDLLKRGEAAPIARHLGAVVGRAHARQLTPEQAAAWGTQLLPKGTCDGRPPDWLWETLIELVGIHEEAYLRHCGDFVAKYPHLR